VTGRAVAPMLRHREPALKLATIESFDGARLVCSGRGVGPWRWAEMLEGAAQTAGLLAGLQRGHIDRSAVIAEYRDVRVHARAHAGALTFTASGARPLLHFHRCACEVRASDGTLLLEGTIAVAPGTPAEAP